MVQGSARVTQGGCKWSFVPDFHKDIKALQEEAHFDEMTLRELKRLMLRASQGTVRAHEWEYPLRTGGNIVGELRLDIENWKYRLYYNEPSTDMTLLIAVVLGLKVHDDDGQWWIEQQKHIGTAKLRLFIEAAIEH